MAFDPSVISQIPTYSGLDVAGDQSKAYQLAGQQQTYQANKQALQDEAQARQALKGADLSSMEGQNKALSQIESPAIRMKLMGQLQQQGLARQESTMNDLKISEERQDALIGVIDPIVAQLQQQAKMPGQNPAMLDAKAKQLALPAALRLRQARPDLAPAIDRFLQEPNGITYQGLLSLDQQTKRGSQAIKDRLAQERQAEIDRENRARDVREERKVNLAESKEEQRRKETQEGVISDESAQLAVDRILAGEQARDVLANFGRGKQGANNISKVQNLLAQTAKERGINAAEITARNVEMKGLAKEQQTEAAIAGRISYAEKEIQQIAPKVLELSDKVSRGNFVPWNRLSQMASSSISDPNLKQLKAYLTTLTNSYDVLGGRGGTDVEKRAHNRALLDAADGPEALKAAVDAIVQEAALSREAAAESMTIDRSRLSRIPGNQAAAGGTPGGAAAPSAGVGGGWGKATVVGGQ